MKWKNLIKVALKSIKKNKTRTMLTSLGIIIGVAAVIVMVSIGTGAQVAIKNQIGSLGTNLLIVFPGTSMHGGVSRGAGSENRLTLDDAKKITEEAKYIEYVSPIVNSGGQVIGGGNNWNTSITGVSPDYLKIRDWEIESGEFFTERDVRSRKKVAVLGKTVADELFPDQDPVGMKIRIRNIPFTVICVLSKKGENVMGRDEDDVVLAPSTTVLYRLKGGNYINMINASAVSVEQMKPAEEELTQILREAHKIEPGEDDNFTIRSQTDIIEMATSTSKTMTLLLGAIACVSLIVGGIGIMNIMLVSVTERTREIGIRLALGAREVDVLLQFLTEAIVLSLLGGIIGILVALLFAFLLNNLMGISSIVSPFTILLAFGFSAAVGVFFGFYPARKASNLNPIDALRYE